MFRPTVRLALLLAGIVALGCAAPPPPLAPEEAPTVTFEHPAESDLPEFKEFVGRLDSKDRVEIRARVSGYLDKVHFGEGDMVEKGKPLYTIDPRPYEASLMKAEADVANWKAQINKAVADLDRSNKASGSGAVTREDVDTKKATLETSRASLRAAEAAVSTAKLDVEFTQITAPVKGRMSRTMVTEGNLVRSGDVLLTTVVPLDPMYVLWDVDEATSLWYSERVYKTKTIPNPLDKGPAIGCAIKLLNEPDYGPEDKPRHPGEIDYIEPSVTRSTGTRLIRGRFANPEGMMSPGYSCGVRVDAGGKIKRVTVPEIAVQSRQRQKFVLCVNDKDEAEERPVKLGDVRDGRQIIDEGVTAKDRVIVNGMLRVRPGAKVVAKQAGSAEKKAEEPAKK